VHSREDESQKSSVAVLVLTRRHLEDKTPCRIDMATLLNSSVLRGGNNFRENNEQLKKNNFVFSVMHVEARTLDSAHTYFMWLFNDA
jgi:hypothetical protein